MFGGRRGGFTRGARTRGGRSRIPSRGRGRGTVVSEVKVQPNVTVKIIKKVPEVKKEVPSIEVKEIANELNETNNVDDLIRVWKVLGEEKTREAVKETLEIESKGGLTVEIKLRVPVTDTADATKEVEQKEGESTKFIEKIETRKRTPGGVFFHLVKTKYATPEQVNVIFKSGKRSDKTKFKKMERERQQYLNQLKKHKKVGIEKKKKEAERESKRKVKPLTSAKDYDDSTDQPDPKQRGGQKRSRIKMKKRGK